MPAATPEGSFLWYELLTRAPERSADFYREVVGWSLQTWELGGAPYWMFAVGERPVAGLMTMPTDVPQEVSSHWLGYVGTPDVDATLGRAVELGAEQVAGPEEIPSVGRFGVFHDPLGAVVAAYTPLDPPEAPSSPPAAGRFSWHELATGDPDAAFDFYAELFGWQETGTFDMGEMGPYRTFGVEGRELGGIYRKPDEAPGGPAWLYYTRVEDLEGAVRRVRDRGGRVLNGPLEVPGGDVVAQCADPDGGDFALHRVVEDRG